MYHRILGTSLLLLAIASSATAQTTVQLTWTDTVNTTHTGYQVSRRIRQPSGALSDYGVLPGAIPPSARTYTDTAPVLGTRNCYAVATLSTQGASALSQPDACADVPAAGSLPQPVTGVSVAVTVTTQTPPPGGPVPTGQQVCTADVREGGRIDLNCRALEGWR